MKIISDNRQKAFLECLLILTAIAILAAMIIPYVEHRREMARRFAYYQWREPVDMPGLKKNIKKEMDTALALDILKTVRHKPVAVGIGYAFPADDKVERYWTNCLLPDKTFLHILYEDGKVAKIQTAPRGKGYPGKLEWSRTLWTDHEVIDLDEYK